MRYYLSELLKAGVIFSPASEKQLCPKTKFVGGVCTSMSVVCKGTLLVGNREIPVKAFLSSVGPSYVKSVLSDDAHSRTSNTHFLRGYIREHIKKNTNGLRDAIRLRRLATFCENLAVKGSGVALILAILSLVRGDSTFMIAVFTFILHWVTIKYVKSGVTVGFVPFTKNEE